MNKKNLVTVSIAAVGVFTVGAMAFQSNKVEAVNRPVSLHAGIGGTWSGAVHAVSMKVENMKSLVRSGNLSADQEQQVRAQILTDAVMKSMSSDGKINTSEFSKQLDDLVSEGVVSLSN